jgi:nucleoid-associated protein YgaU
MSRLNFSLTSRQTLGLGTSPKASSTQPAPPPKSADQAPKPSTKGDQLEMGTKVTGTATPSISFQAEPQFIMHKVKRGETLGQLAKKYLGNPNLHPEIFNANRDDLGNPNDLRIGMVLKIPVPADSKPTETDKTPPPPRPVTVEPKPVSKPEPQTFSDYTVKRGQSLSIIALRTLGDSERYMEIYQANRDQLKSPDDLHPGMVLKIPAAEKGATPSAPPKKSESTPAAVENSGVTGVDSAGLTPGAQELYAAMQRYQQHHAQLGNRGRTKTTPAQMREIAKELDSASKAFGVDPKMMLALYAHESGGINPGARSHTGAGGLGQLTSIAIRQVHFMAGIGKGNRGTAPYTQYKGNFIQSSRSINQRYNIKSNIWTSVAYMSYELNDRARLGRGVEKALKRYGDPHVPTYANKVNSEYKTLFGGKIF